MSMQTDPLRRVLLFRHGVTDWNQERRWQGRVDVPLNATGLRQAEQAAVSLVRDTSLTVLAHSTARRATQTATVLRGAFELAGRPLIVVPRDDLVEIDVGQWAGHLQADVLAREPGVAEQLRDENFPYGETGESLSDVAARARAAVDDVVSMLGAGQTAVVVTHGAVIRSVVANLVGSPAAAIVNVLGSIRNCHWVELTYGEAGWRIERWNASS